MEDAIAYIATKLKKEGAVVKTEKMFAGIGVLILKHHETMNLSETEIKEYLRQKMSEQYWK